MRPKEFRCKRIRKSIGALLRGSDATIIHHLSRFSLTLTRLTLCVAGLAKFCGLQPKVPDANQRERCTTADGQSRKRAVFSKKVGFYEKR